ncbi:NAD(P)-dependent malic enzyme [Arcanobacterium hippocoleae]|uniref:Malate dehydrogenase (Oxaloacetate-decarboxylating) n=1 Tax=Arcanobacterium hippocoleae TaxID=149017 RepID=A0ABU1T1F0_9ACTO|nr:NADP-dependent malic enzyme [Arcanobacterium hippocoleae]MDR6939202.1 malate dehydrogenase (oxaloacetate-decarboxylating) [Arcanobacterium hippocoleae]
MKSIVPSYSVTMRCKIPFESKATPALIQLITQYGALVYGVDTVKTSAHHITVDVTTYCDDFAHAKMIRERLETQEHISVLGMHDAVAQVHLGGKIETGLRRPLKTRQDLGRIYTPGVARICDMIHEDPEKAYKFTSKRNTVAVVTDGTAVLGLGDIGPAAAMPVMEGKAALFKNFANVDAWPICLDTKDTDEIVSIVKAIAPGFGGINLEDISAPRCFEIERRLRAELDIPVFHDDQHGTAVVTLAALINALKVVGKKISDVKIVVSGVGAAGNAIIRLLLKEGAKDIIGCGRAGSLGRFRQEADPDRQWLAENTNPRNVEGSLKEVLVGADVFIGVSSGNILDPEDIGTMASDAIVFAMANPTPEVDPIAAAKYAKVVATGRSDFPNQINNVLVFPGLFRGLLDLRAKAIDVDLLSVAARAIAQEVEPDQLNANYIVPGVFHPDMAYHVADAIKQTFAQDDES